MPERPNILLIMTDQQRGDCLSIEDHPVLMTPNMDSIAGAGVHFSRCYTTCQSCIAARRSLLSGQFPDTHGMVGYRDSVEWDAPPTLPGVLSDAGYHTCWTGRGIHQHPPRKRYGFDHMVVGSQAAGDYDEWLQQRAPQGSDNMFAGGVTHNDWTARPWHLDEALHPTNWTIHEALQFLRKRDPSCPFFLAVSFIAPHPPLNPPAFYMERYLRMDPVEPVIGDWAIPPPDGGKGLDVSSGNCCFTGETLRACRAAYYGLINHVDDQIRRFFNPSSAIGQLIQQNTVVIFTSDHGEMLGDHYLWRKSLPYEPSARIPLLIRAPQQFGLQTGLACDRPVCLEDIMPTVLDLAGVDVPDTVDGQSLLPLMRGEQSQWREWLHLQHSPRHHTLTDGKEKYIWFVQDGREQFFDLQADPQERRDLARDPETEPRMARWRDMLIRKLEGRPEGFSDGKRLIPGREFPPVLPHGGTCGTPLPRALN